MGFPNLIGDNRPCLLKNSGPEQAFHRILPWMATCFFVSSRGSGSCDLWGCLIKEANQPFEILCHGCQVELFAHEPHPTQSQTTQSDLVLQFRKQCFHLSPSPL